MDETIKECPYEIALTTSLELAKEVGAKGIHLDIESATGNIQLGMYCLKLIQQKVTCPSPGGVRSPTTGKLVCPLEDLASLIQVRATGSINKGAVAIDLASFRPEVSEPQAGSNKSPTGPYL
jgi:hypothetical protein